MNDQKKIERALSSFLHDYVRSLAQILATAVKKGRISYEEIEKLIEPGDDIEEVLLLGYDWRILVPVRSFKSMQWGDRVLMPMPGEIYELPNVVRYLVRGAITSGTWEPWKAEAAIAREIGESAWDRIPRIVEMLGECAEGRNVTAIQIKEACKAFELEHRVDSLIADLKASGIISPTLGYLPEAAKKMTPVYELNPSLLSGHQD